MAALQSMFIKTELFQYLFGPFIPLIKNNISRWARAAWLAPLVLGLVTSWTCPAAAPVSSSTSPGTPTLTTPGPCSVTSSQLGHFQMLQLSVMITNTSKLTRSFSAPVVLYLPEFWITMTQTLSYTSGIIMVLQCVKKNVPSPSDVEIGENSWGHPVEWRVFQKLSLI